MATEDLFTLKGSVAFVTGASSGIGLHLANVLARAGAKVAIAARRKEKDRTHGGGLGFERSSSACSFFGCRATKNNCTSL